MITEPMAMRGSLCPICKSQMFVNGSDAESYLGCTNVECDYNNKETREAYFRHKHRSIIAGDMMRNIKNDPGVLTTMKKPKIDRD
jgi:hypothetical protein